jgi:hypothetical protein
MRRKHPPTASSVLTLACAFALLATPAAASPVQHEGIAFASQLRAGAAVLRLHGVALLRYRAVLKVYVAALYLGEGVAPEAVLGDVPRRLEIAYFRSIPADAFARATRDGIARNVSPVALAALADRLERLGGLYADVDPGDRYALTYQPGLGTELALNGRPLGRIEGADFATAVFSIWLGEAPLDASLKAGLLGRSPS